MSFFMGRPIGGSGGSVGEAAQLDQCLIVDDADAGNLAFTPAGASGRTKNVIVCWFKRGTLGVANMTLWSVDGANNDNDELKCRFSSGNLLQIVGGTTTFLASTAAICHDTTGWECLVVCIDTTEASAANRLKVYRLDGLNGFVELTSWGTDNRASITSSMNMAVGSANPHYVADFPGEGHWDGRIADFTILNGQSVQAGDVVLNSAFVQSRNSKYEWRDQSGLTYGTNGCRLQFQDSAAMGDDTSGNGNDFTPTNISSVNQIADSPTINLCNMAAEARASVVTLFNAGREATISSGNKWGITGMCVPAGAGGKYSMEFEMISGAGVRFGIIEAEAIGYFRTAGTPYTLTQFDSWTAGDNVDDVFEVSGGTTTTYSAVLPGGNPGGDPVTVELNMDDEEVAFRDDTGITAAYSLPAGKSWAFICTGNGNTNRVYFDQAELVNTPSTDFDNPVTGKAIGGNGLTSGTFHGNANADGPVVFMGGRPESGTVTLNGNAATEGTHYRALCIGIKIITASTTYNPASDGVAWAATIEDDRCLLGQADE